MGQVPHDIGVDAYDYLSQIFVCHEGKVLYETFMKIDHQTKTREHCFKYIGTNRNVIFLQSDINCRCSGPARVNRVVWVPLCVSPVGHKKLCLAVIKNLQAPLHHFLSTLLYPDTLFTPTSKPLNLSFLR